MACQSSPFSALSKRIEILPPVMTSLEHRGPKSVSFFKTLGNAKHFNAILYQGLLMR